MCDSSCTVTNKRAGVQSVAIVPVGMTRFRERLPQLTHVERDYARRMITHVHRLGEEFTRTHGTRFAWLADEWYHIAGEKFPPRSHYEEFPQLEDGIGTIRLFLESLKQITPRLPARVPVPIEATLVTAEMPAAYVQNLADRLNRVEGVNLNVCVVKNDFFGGDIHIAGLLTAQDILAQLKAYPDCHQTVYIPKICLRDDTLFLDDVTLEEACATSGLDLRAVGNTPRELALALGLIRAPHEPRVNASRWFMEENVSI